MNRRTAKVIAVVMVVSPALVVGVLGCDARMRRAAKERDQASIGVLAKRLPTSDLALSGGSRWLRAISLEEPGAAFADGPALPDPDPAGAAMAPPTAVWGAKP